MHRAPLTATIKRFDLHFSLFQFLFFPSRTISFDSRTPATFYPPHTPSPYPITKRFLLTPPHSQISLFIPGGLEPPTLQSFRTDLSFPPSRATTQALFFFLWTAWNQCLSILSLPSPFFFPLLLRLRVDPRNFFGSTLFAVSRATESSFRHQLWKPSPVLGIHHHLVFRANNHAPLPLPVILWPTDNFFLFFFFSFCVGFPFL